MASSFYHSVLPDYRDLDNATKSAPGYELYVCENDGGIGVQMWPAGANPDKGNWPAVFLNIEEARELLTGLQKAIDRAGPKNKDRVQHKGRARRPK